MGITQEKLAEMAALDIKEADISMLADIRDIKIDTDAPVDEKLALFAEQAPNIYVNRAGNYIVKVSYQESGPSINDKMEEYIRRMSDVYL